MQPWMSDVPAAVVRVKAELAKRIPDVAGAVPYPLRPAGAGGGRGDERGARPAGPSRRSSTGTWPPARSPAPLAERIRRRGCAVVRGVFPACTHRCLERRDRRVHRAEPVRREAEEPGRASTSTSPPSAPPPRRSTASTGRGHRCSARQSDELARVRAALNRLWRQPAGAPAFVADRECSYADRLRRRQPGDTTLGLSPHADGGSVERWCDPSYQRVYGEVLFGDPTRYDPFDATHRVSTEEIPSPAVCSVFRTFQGWTALSEQGPGDGTLQLIPIANLMGWLLLRALQPDVAADELCGAKAGKAMPFEPRWHEAAAAAQVPDPEGAAGRHRLVAQRHHPRGGARAPGQGVPPTSSTSAPPPGARRTRPSCRARPRPSAQGKSCPDFAAEDYEVDFEGRADRGRPDAAGARARLGPRPLVAPLPVPESFPLPVPESFPPPPRVIPPWRRCARVGLDN